MTLRFTRPPGFEHLSQEAWAELLRSKVREVEREEAARRRLHGIRVMGRKKILRQSPRAYPATSETRRQLNPRVAARNKWRHIEALRRKKLFAKLYAEALDLFRGGNREVVFPAGTWWFHHYGGAKCAPAPS